MPNDEHIQEIAEKKFQQKDKKKRKRMGMSGKSVLKLAEIIKNKAEKKKGKN